MDWDLGVIGVIILLFIVIAVLAALAQAYVLPVFFQAKPVSPEILRFVDNEAGVVCWYYNGSRVGTALSCLPKSQTTLDK